MASVTDSENENKSWSNGTAGTAVSPFASLRFRFSLILILALIPAVVYLVYDALMIRQRVQAAAEQELLRLSEITATTYEQRLDEAERILATIAIFPAVRTGDTAACSARLAQMVELYQSHYPDFGVTDANGNFICTATPLAANINVSDRFWFQEAIRTGEFSIGGFNIGRASGYPVLSLGYPIVDENGQVVRVLGHGLRLDALQAEAEELPIPPDAVLTITDHNGIILARVPDGEQWMGRPQADEEFQHIEQGEGVIEAVGVDGVRRLYAAVSITGPGNTPVWLTLGRTPEAVYAALERAIVRDILSLGVVLLVALTAVWLGGNRFLLRKIDRLVETSQQLARGDLAARAPVSPRGNELDVLARTFNQMADALQQRINEEQRIQAELLERERQLQLAWNAARMVIWTWDPALDLVQTSENLPEIYGLDSVAYAEQGFSLLHPEDRPRHEEIVSQAMADKVPYRSEFRISRPDNGRIIWLDERATPVLDEHGRVQKLVGVIIDVTERRQIEVQVQQQNRRLQALAEASRAFAEAGTAYQPVLDAIVRQIGQTLGDSCAIRLPNADGLHHVLAAIYHSDPETAAFYRELNQTSLRPDEGISGQVFTTGQPIFLPTITAEQIRADTPARFWPYLEKFAIHSGMVLPLRAHGRIIGTMNLSRDITPQPYTEDDLRLAGDLADRAALAIENARLYRAEQAAHQAANRTADRIARLQQITSALSSAFTPEELAYAVVEQGVLATEASAGIIVELLDNGQELKTIAAYGYPVAAIRTDPVPLSAPTPMSDCIRAGQPIWIKSHQEFAAQYPALAELRGRFGNEATAAIPLFLGEKVLGGLAFSFREQQEFDQEQREFLLAVARQCAQGLNRAFAEEALRASENNLRIITNTVPALISYVDTEHRYQFANETYHNWFGYTPKEIVGKHIREVLGETAYEAILPQIERVLSGETLTFDRLVPYKDGGSRFVLINYVPDKDASGKINGYYSLVQDITERKKAELGLQLLAQLSELVRQLTAPDDFLYAVAELVGEHLQVQRSMFVEIDSTRDRGLIPADYHQGLPSVAGEYRLSDYSPEAGKEMDAGHTVVNQDAQLDPRTADLYEAVYAPHGERAYVAVPLMRNGQRVAVFWVSSNRPRDWQTEEISLLETVAERAWNAVEKLRLDRQLRESEERFRNVANIVPSMVWTADAQGIITYANDEWFRYVGITPEQNARGWPELVLHPDDFERCVQAWTLALQTGEDYEIEVRNRRYDGEYRWFLTRARSMRNKTGDIIAWFGVTTDINERKLAERRSHFLAEATRTLTQSLDMTHTLQEVAQLAVPDLADWCTLNLLQPDGRIILAAAAHRQPEQEANLWAWAERYPLQPGATEGTPQVIRTGKPELYHFTAADPPENLPEWAQEAGLSSLLIVPLKSYVKSYGRTFGALTLASTESGRRFDQEDLALAEEVARRAALALENAQLYEAEQQAREFLEVRVRERTAELERSSAQLRELMARLQTAREEEQTRLSRELHDQLGGALTTLKLDLTRLQQRATDEAVQARLEDLLRGVDETIDLTRHLSRELRPAVLDFFGLAAALEWQVQEFEKRVGIRGRFLSNGLKVEVEGPIATALFRVSQEALTNVARHAQASEVSIRLEQDAEYVTLQVQDNGRGIRSDELTNTKSLGLLGMHERVRLFAGELNISGTEGGGTTVLAKIPLSS